MSSSLTNRLSNEEILQRLKDKLRKGVFEIMGVRKRRPFEIIGVNEVLTPEQELDIKETTELISAINDDIDLQRDAIIAFKWYSYLLCKHLRISNLTNAKIALSINDDYYLSTDKNEEVTTYLLKRILKMKNKIKDKFEMFTWYNSFDYKSILSNINYTTKRHFQLLIRINHSFGISRLLESPFTLDDEDILYLIQKDSKYLFGRGRYNKLDVPMGIIKRHRMNHLFEGKCNCCGRKKKWCFKTCIRCQFYQEVNACLRCWLDMNNSDYIIGKSHHEDRDLQEDSSCPWCYPKRSTQQDNDNEIFDFYTKDL